MSAPEIRVGTYRGAATVEPPPAEGGAYWVDVDGVRLDKGVISVTYEAKGGQFNFVTVRFACSSFASVDKDGETEDLTRYSGGFGDTDA